MAQLACELCGGTDLVKQEGLFVCRSCGAKYSVEEARALMGADAAAPAARPKTSARVEEIKARARAAAAEAKAKARAAELDLASLLGMHDSRAINNSAVQAFQALIADYRAIEHPSEDDLKAVADKAREILSAFQSAALVDPDDHLADLLIYRNCMEAVDAVRDLCWWERDEEGEWRKRSFGVSASDLRIAGQKDSWDDLARSHQDYVETIWLDENEPRVNEQRALRDQARQLEEQLANLKDEKRGLGIGANIPIISNLVNPEAKEMNERMKPVKDELGAVNSQIASIDREKESWVDGQLDDLARSYARLSF